MQNDDLCNVWQSQSFGPGPGLEGIRRRAGQFRSRIWRRNLREYLAMAVVIPWFGYGAWRAPSALMRLGDGLMVAGVVWILLQLHRRAGTGTSPEALGQKDCAVFHRTELVRQRDALRSVWQWYLGPLLPGLGVIVTEGAEAGFHRSMAAGSATLVYAGLAGLLLWWIGWLNRKAADRLQSEIEAMDAGR